MKDKFTLHHDFVFAGGSVIRIGNNLLTASDVYSNSLADNKTCVNLRVNKDARKDYFEGDILILLDDFKVKIYKLSLAEGGAKGKIYLKKQT